MIGIPPNDNETRGMNRYAKGNEVARWRRDAGMALEKCSTPYPAARLEVKFGFKVYKRQGLDAYVGACKPIVDAFVDRGYIEDDGWAILREVTATAHKSMQNMVTLTLTEIVE
jgi:hypothetical protein